MATAVLLALWSSALVLPAPTASLVARRAPAPILGEGKGALGGAVVGGLLAGPFGALWGSQIGAAVGANAAAKSAEKKRWAALGVSEAMLAEAAACAQAGREEACQEEGHDKAEESEEEAGRRRLIDFFLG